MDEMSDDGPSSRQTFLQDIRAASELMARASRKIPDIGFADPEKVQGALLVAAAKTSLVVVVAVEDLRQRVAPSHRPPSPEKD